MKTLPFAWLIRGAKTRYPTETDGVSKIARGGLVNGFGRAWPWRIWLCIFQWELRL